MKEIIAMLFIPLITLTGCESNQNHLPSSIIEPTTSSQKSESATNTTSTDQNGHRNPEDFIPDGMHLYRVIKGDLNNDGNEDAAVIYGPSFSKEMGTYEKRWDPRTLALLIMDGAGNFTLAKSSKTLIPCPYCGGTLGDPFTDMEITSGAFTVLLQGGSREMWSEQFTFTFSQTDNDWLLTNARSRAADRLTGYSNKLSDVPAAFQNIPFEIFDRDKFKSAEI